MGICLPGHHDIMELIYYYSSIFIIHLNMEGEQKSGSGLVAVLGVVLVLALIGVAWFFMRGSEGMMPGAVPVVETDTPTTQPATGAPEAARVPANAGDVDAIAASLVAEADADAAAMASTDAEVSLVAADGQAVSDYNTTYDSTAY